MEVSSLCSTQVRRGEQEQAHKMGLFGVTQLSSHAITLQPTGGTQQPQSALVSAEDCECSGRNVCVFPYLSHKNPHLGTGESVMHPHHYSEQC